MFFFHTRRHGTLATGLSSFVKLANDGLAQSHLPLLAAPGRGLRFSGLAARLSPCPSAQTRYPRRNALDWLHLADAGGGPVALPRAGGQSHPPPRADTGRARSEEHTSELQLLRH